MSYRKLSPVGRIVALFLITALVIGGTVIPLQFTANACSSSCCNEWLNVGDGMAMVVPDSAGSGKVYPADIEKLDYRQTATEDYFNQQTAGKMTADESKDFYALREFMNLPRSCLTGTTLQKTSGSMAWHSRPTGLPISPISSRGNVFASGITSIN